MKSEQAMALADWDDDAELDEVGTSAPRIEAHEKVTGSARYTVDVDPPGLLHLVVVRSPHAHAEVRSIDTSAAEAVAGVVAVCTPDDLADGPTWFDEQVPFLGSRVRFVGDEVVAVIAETLDAARDAASLVEVEYEPLDHVTDPLVALADGAPVIHGDSNVVDDDTTERGDVDAALTDAHLVVEAEFRTPTQIHNSMEPHCAVAEWDGRRLTVHASTQGVNDVRESLADTLGLDHQQVRVIADHIGGGFGAKQVPWKPTLLASLASMRLGRPVSAVNDRRAENLAAGKRNATVQRVRIGADAEGRLTAIDLDVVTDHGAYSAPGEASNVAGSFLNLYRCENVRTRSRQVYTNTGPAVAFRAPGYVEAAFALESAVDEIADRLGLDPIEVRRRNYTERDQQNDLPWSSPDALRTAYERLEESGWGDPLEQPDRSGVRRGRGVAANEWMAATAMPPGYAWGEFNSDGSVHIATSTQDIGTGARTSLTQVAAEELGIDPSRVRVSMGDTAAGPPAPTSAGSTTTPTMAPAVRAAASALRERLLGVAAQHLQTSAGELTLDGDTVRSISDEDVSIGVAELLDAIAPQGIHAEGARLDKPDDVSPRTHGAAMAEVEVDEWTGEVRVTRLVIAPDCGRIIDPKLVDSQVIGGAAQGIGFALTERQTIDPGLGRIVDDDLEDYLLPTIGDTCETVHAVVGIPDVAVNPLGVKGIGELPLIPVPAAIANAVHDAIGIRFHELPLARRRVLDAIAERERRSGEPGGAS